MTGCQLIVMLASLLFIVISIFRIVISHEDSLVILKSPVCMLRWFNSIIKYLIERERAFVFILIISISIKKEKLGFFPLFSWGRGLNDLILFLIMVTNLFSPPPPLSLVLWFTPSMVSQYLYELMIQDIKSCCSLVSFDHQFLLCLCFCFCHVIFYCSRFHLCACLCIHDFVFIC